MIPAYVLHSFSYKETSLIIKFFTKEHGLVHLIAKGAKRKKYSSAVLQPFVPLLIHWKYHSTNLAVLYQAEAQGLPYKLANYCLFGALYINELLIKLLATMDPYPELFDFYNQFLAELNNLKYLNSPECQLELEKHLRIMEKNILKAIGYELQLNKESLSDVPILLNEKYYFDVENGIRKLNHDSIVLTQIFCGSSLLALHNNYYANTTERQEAKLFMRTVLAKFLGKQVINTKKLFI